jgi:hypothetical protein
MPSDGWCDGPVKQSRPSAERQEYALKAAEYARIVNELQRASEGLERRWWRNRSTRPEMPFQGGLLTVRCARRSDDTDASSGAASGAKVARSALMLPYPALI